tara:strand:+ start:262 stop:762 length:501 start_codon:yes stop_codon:yes gene_type:complete
MNFLHNLQNIKKDFFNKESFVHLLIIVIIFFSDRLSKAKILKDFSEDTFFVNDFINFDLIWNIGIGFGLLSSDSSLFYNLVTILIGLVIVILIYVFLTANKLEKFTYSLIIGGALGNFYDRLVYKAVPDFIDLHYNNFHWFTFNVADIFITVGILVFILRSFFIKD